MFPVEATVIMTTEASWSYWRRSKVILFQLGKLALYRKASRNAKDGRVGSSEV